MNFLSFVNIILKVRVNIWGSSRFTYHFIKNIIDIKNIEIVRVVSTNIGTIYKELRNLMEIKNIKYTDKTQIYPETNIVCSYGNYIPERIFGKGVFLNVHPSLLPKYRGANPIIQCVLNGDRNTGVTFHQMTKKIDEGPLYKKIKYRMKINETSLTLEEKLAELSAKKIYPILENINKMKPKSQKGLMSMTSRDLTNMENAEINWNWNIEKIRWFIQGYYDNPIAWNKLDKNILKIYPGIIKKTNIKDHENGEILFDKVNTGIYTNGYIYVPEFFLVSGKRPLKPVEFYNGYAKMGRVILN